LNATATELKRCVNCGQLKPRGDFWRNCRASDGLASGCKSCIRAYKQEYYKSEAGKATRQRSSETYAKKSPAHNRARSIVSAAKSSGRIFAGPCEVCGAERTHAHHDDYNKPLEVRWLCPMHHKEWHMNNKAVEATSLQRRHPLGKSGVRGVTPNQWGNYQAWHRKNYLGTFPTIEEAAKAVAAAESDAALTPPPSTGEAT
jgi:hypothetical protein